MWPRVSNHRRLSLNPNPDLRGNITRVQSSEALDPSRLCLSHNSPGRHQRHGSLHAGPRSRRLPVTTLLVLNPREHHIESPGWTNMEKNRKKVDTVHAWPQPRPWRAPRSRRRRTTVPSWCTLSCASTRMRWSGCSSRDVAAGYRNSAYGAAEGDSPLAAGRGARGRTAERASTIRQAYFRNWVWCRGSGAWVWTGAERLNPLSSLHCCRVARASISIPSAAPLWRLPLRTAARPAARPRRQRPRPVSAPRGPAEEEIAGLRQLPVKPLPLVTPAHA